MLLISDFHFSVCNKNLLVQFFPNYVIKKVDHKSVLIMRSSKNCSVFFASTKDRVAKNNPLIQKVPRSIIFNFTCDFHHADFTRAVAYSLDNFQQLFLGFSRRRGAGFKKNLSTSF